jgi:2-polyprenyl-6-methoxyphenol hydroxylase-like FAD-dependent oxidoreductase
VVIIGAGVMGLTTALQLAERGYEVTILEKADRVATVRGSSSKTINKCKKARAYFQFDRLGMDVINYVQLIFLTYISLK